MRYKKRVVIGIVARNEENNISRLLSSIFSQENIYKHVMKVIVICDGCTDKTEDRAKSFKRTHNILEVKNDHKELGKARRLQFLYKYEDFDYIITFDADCMLSHNKVIKEILSEFNDNKVGLVSCRDVPFPPTTLFEKITETSNELWFQTRKQINHGDTVHNCTGLAMALSKKLCDKLKMPRDLIIDDEYVYLFAKKLGFKFVFRMDIKIYTRYATNLKDYLKQNSRYLSGKYSVLNYFRDNMEPEYFVPMAAKIYATLLVALSRPLYLPLAILLQVYLRVYTHINPILFTKTSWIQIESTKN